MALEAKRAAHIHLLQDDLEDYAFGRLPQGELAHFEEHLLTCPHCQRRLDEEDNFAEAMLTLAAMQRTAAVKTLPASPLSAMATASSAAARTRRPSLGLKWISSKWNFPIEEFRNTSRPVLKCLHTPAWGAGLAGIIAIGFGVAGWRLPVIGTSGDPAERASGQIDVVTLKTLRGASGDSMAEARPNRPLDLSLDFSETPSSAAETGPYRLEVVDAAGNRAWTGAAISSVSGKIAARVEKRLAAGTYWVRLYSRSGKLMREFGLRLG